MLVIGLRIIRTLRPTCNSGCKLFACFFFLFIFFLPFTIVVWLAPAYALITIAHSRFYFLRDYCVSCLLLWLVLYFIVCFPSGLGSHPVLPTHKSRASYSRFLVEQVRAGSTRFVLTINLVLEGPTVTWEMSRP